MHYSHLLSAFCQTPWAISQEKLVEMRLFLLRKAKGETIPQAEIDAVLAERRPAEPQQKGKIAVLPIVGTLVHRATGMDELCGLVSTQMLAKRFDAMVNDSGIKAIVLDIDSPGGSVYGMQEFGDRIAEARSQKKIYGISNAMAASGAYWLASQVDELWITPTGHVGSIGVYIAHEDVSKALEQEGVSVTLVSAGKYKTEGNPFGPLSDEARQYLQDEVDRYYQMFTKAVASGREVTVKQVRDQFGQGRVFGAEQAKQAGMVDRIGSLQDLLARLGVGSTAGSNPMASTPFNRLKAELDLAEAV